MDPEEGLRAQLLEYIVYVVHIVRYMNTKMYIYVDNKFTHSYPSENVSPIKLYENLFENFQDAVRMVKANAFRSRTSNKLNRFRNKIEYEQRTCMENEENEENMASVKIKRRNVRKLKGNLITMESKAESL